MNAKQETQKPPYRSPRVYPDVAAVSLDDFNIEEIKEYLKQKSTKDMGSQMACTPDDLVFDSEDLSRIETLALCGQIEHARSEVLKLVSDHIGRQL